MKKFLVVLLIALATCAAIEEGFDEEVNLEKSFVKKVKDKVKNTVKKGTDTVKNLPKKVVKIPEKVVKETGKVAKKTVKDILNHPIKGLNGLFKGKVGEVFRKLKDVVKKGIAWLKQNNLWEPIVNKVKELGEKYGNELCEKALPAEICGPAVDFALNHLIKN